MTRQRPGERLRAWASRVCSARAMTRLIDPVIADLQSEYAEAASRKQVTPNIIFIMVTVLLMRTRVHI
jgi:hypothetical protein